MPLVNVTFFLGEINIPNAGVSAPATDNLNYMIAKYEPECLLLVLGYPLFKLFENESSPRMASLLSGSEYLDRNGNLAMWKGLVYGTNNSLIAYYIYEKWARSKATVVSGTGNAVAKQNAAEAVSFGDKIIYSHNKFSELTEELLSFLWNYTILDVTAFPEMNSFLYTSIKDSTKKINGFGI